MQKKNTDGSQFSESSCVVNLSWVVESLSSPTGSLLARLRSSSSRNDHQTWKTDARILPSPPGGFPHTESSDLLPLSLCLIH